MSGLTKRIARDDGFGRSSRFYETPAGTYPSVTSILSVVGKPALVNWAAKVEREMVSSVSADMHKEIHGTPMMTRPVYLATLESRIGKERAHRKLLEAASNIGSQAHALIEWTLRDEMGQEQGAAPSVSPEAAVAFAAFQRWRNESKLSVSLIEQTVWSAIHGYAGTLDWYGAIKHPAETMILGDWKTGKAIYAESYLQASAYAMALVEMGHVATLPGAMIVRLPKTKSDPGFETAYVPPDELQEHFRSFLAVKSLWEWKERMDQDHRSVKEDHVMEAKLHDRPPVE